jgi:DNA-binding CsgD family transcriptional regulator
MKHSGGILRTFSVHTDISHLKAHGNPVFSLIGLEGESSYIDIMVDNVFEAASIMVSDREREILRLVIAGMTSKSIAEYFSLSADAIKQHCKNMLRKTGAKCAADLVAQAVKKEWL